MKFFIGLDCKYLMSKARAHLRISGRVQGVFFRATSRDKANSLDITGWVRNNPDGTVEAVVEGEKEKINEYIKWAHKGSSAARVDEVNVEWEDYQEEFDNYSIVHH